ncbi:MAG TPA: MBL fold metallo-hydrolase [Candidatus Dormibacteraeota bacterium]|nr:MBL fold metallo-hydrolase [Candidatus Dormibacteraeota bacterium]
MELTFVGLSCVRLRGRDVEVVIDPIPPGASSRPPRVNPDIVVRTEGTVDLSLLRPGEGRPQEVSGPGEYELRGVSVFGVAAGATTIMRVEVDDVRVCALGRLHRQLTESEIDALGHLDVLAVPVGGGDGLEAQAAARLVNALEPAIVVPVRYAVPGVDGDYEPVDKFAKEMGLAEGWVPQPKLNLTGSLPTSEETRVVVLEPRAVAP